MRIIFTCGGTGGHIYPAVSVANLIRERHPDAAILFVGAENGMETRLVPREGYELRTVRIANLRHSLSPRAVKHNLRSLRLLLGANAEARRIIDDFKPDAVVGTGGYASYPVTLEAAKRGIPTAVHESNAMPGWTTRMLASKVDVMLISFEASRKYYPRAKRVETVGTPVRSGFFDRPAPSAKPLLLSFWGSLGARDMNRMMLGFMKLGGAFEHIHASGKSAFAEMSREAGDRVREFI
ncbi:MAG: glycosyltransferase, partial [Oscillospiraceae bacterium]|nr:glycosyltransferase [Oscillospiraceae bacterium]